MAAQKVTAIQLAGFLNLSTARITQLKNDGFFEPDAENKYDFLASVKAYIANLQANYRKGGEEREELRLAQIRELQAKSDLKEFELSVKRSEHVHINDVRGLFVEVVKVCSNGASELGDYVERVTGAKPELIDAVIAASDIWRKQLYEQLLKLTGGEIESSVSIASQEAEQEPEEDTEAAPPEPPKKRGRKRKDER
jgi:hypothetical protein